jgi:hypothetical protein
MIRSRFPGRKPVGSAQPLRYPRARFARISLLAMSDAPAPRWLAIPVEALSVLIAGGLAVLAGRVELPRRAPAAPSSLNAPALELCTPTADAYLRGQLHGDLQVPVNWSGTEMRCAGMLRPDGAGLRLLFAPADRGSGPLFVIGLAGTPQNMREQEIAANLTIVDEGSSRFFNSGDGERCWAQAAAVRQAATGSTAGYRIAGRLYCAGALAEVNGPGTITPGEFEFAGLISVADD